MNGSTCCSVGRGKKANLDKSDTLKTMALSDLPVPKKGALRQIGHLKKRKMRIQSRVK
jgi:hypothetical protein